MDKNKKNPEEAKKHNQKFEENAINENATQGEKINHQEKQKQEKHQPRDNA